MKSSMKSMVPRSDKINYLTQDLTNILNNAREMKLMTMADKITPGFVGRWG